MIVLFFRFIYGVVFSESVPTGDFQAVFTFPSFLLTLKVVRIWFRSFSLNLLRLSVSSVSSIFLQAGSNCRDAAVV